MTNFPIHYHYNIIPCYIYHKSCSFKLIWYKPFSSIDYPSVLSICFEGIIETAHPYKFIARQACKELLMAENSHNKIIPIIPKLYEYIRIALLDENDETFNDAVDICYLLVIFNIYIAQLLLMVLSFSKVTLKPQSSEFQCLKS